MFFEVLGYILVVLIAGYGSYKLALSVEEAGLGSNAEKFAGLMLAFVAFLGVIFFAGCSLGGRDQRVAEHKVEIVKEAKAEWDNGVKDKFAAYNTALERRKNEFSVVTNELARIKVELFRLDKTNKDMSSNMVPRYVVAPIVGVVEEFDYSSIFPRYDFEPLVVPVEPEVPVDVKAVGEFLKGGSSGSSTNKGESVKKPKIVGQGG